MKDGNKSKAYHQVQRLSVRYLKGTAYGLVILLTAIIQSLPHALPSFGGARPLLIIPVVVCIAMFEGPVNGAIAGIAPTAQSFEVSGLSKVAEEEKAVIKNFDREGTVTAGGNPSFLDKLYLAKPLFDADLIINLPKLKTHSGCIYTGAKDGKEVRYYVYNVCDHEECYHEVGSQAISYTTGVPAMIGAEMVLTGKWKKPGVFNVEEMDPDPFMDELNRCGLPWKESFQPEMVE
jgi:hypothetical protein